ncbi:MAG: energy-coupled thiamine transporter ThiT [Clostridiales bacterium]|nr:energy-coupled thiamine transporter ThiT [Clostridiales bacterium]MDO4350253.1 energy-coupled thiamine transporter ThiT [Eubacteriales bacterium]MDY4009119.1 energy-coupled thiamine transporter ThiT [Candidatus Limiplasma sp.]
MAFKFEDVNLTGWILVGVLIVCAAALFVIARNRQKWTTRMLANAAICMALSFLLSYIRLFKLPQGGSVTAASLLPIIAFAYSYGTAPGLVVGIAYGFLQMIQDPWIVGPIQAILDYPLAFGCIALAGIARKLPDTYGWLVGVLLAGIGRFVCHVLSGVVFFAEYAEGTGLSPFVYSVSYNSFVFVDLAICAVVIAFPQVRKALKRMTEEHR